MDFPDFHNAIPNLLDQVECRLERQLSSEEWLTFISAFNGYLFDHGCQAFEYLTGDGIDEWSDSENAEEWLENE